MKPTYLQVDKKINQQLLKRWQWSEFISHALQKWRGDNKIKLQYIQPGRPMQKGYIERNNGCIRRELLNNFLCESLTEVRIMTEQWRNDYNLERPPKALGYLLPLKYAEQKAKPEQH